MTLSYAFGGNTGQSYDALQRRRAYLEAVQKAGQGAQPKTGAEGILSGLNSVFSDLMLRKLGKQEDANREAANQKALDLFGQPSQYGGGGASVPAYVPPDPNSPSQLGHDTMVALGKAPATPTKDEVSAYIAAKATELGIDPSVAVAVANSEGLNANPADGWQSNFVKNGQREPSYGPFQLYMGGGLGNNFLEQTGLDPRDPTTWKKQVDFALGHAKNNGWGSWYGARNAGIGDFQGIGGQPQGASGIDPNIVQAMGDPNVSPEIKSALGVLLQQRIAAAQPPEPAKPIEINNKLVDPTTGKVLGDYGDPQAPQKPIQVGDKLVDPVTFKVIGDYSKPDEGTANQKDYKFYSLQEVAQGRTPMTFEEYQAANKSGTNLTVDMGGGSNKQVFDAMDARSALAQSSYNALTALNNAEAAVDSGIINGAGANQILGLKKVASAMGMDDSQIVNTETFVAAMAPVVAATLKATAGTANLSNADMEFAKKAAAGDITLDARSIKRLIGILRASNEAVVKSFNGKLDKVYPDDGKGTYSRERALFGLGEIPVYTPAAPTVINGYTIKALP